MATYASARLAQGRSRANAAINQATAGTTTLDALLASNPSSVLLVYSRASAPNFRSLEAAVEKLLAAIRQRAWSPPAGT
jgi:hypothetical protein